MSVPSSTIYIMSGVPLNNSYEHTLYFETKEEQNNYFLDHTLKGLHKFTFLRPERIIKVAGDFANARSWNYLRFQNADGKWYYHFINKVEYINDSAVELHIELDVIQTFMFDWKLHECFIERTHTKTDEFGEHTIPEGLETGPLIRYHTQEINLEDNVILVLMSVTQGGNDSWGKMYGGVYSGLSVYAVQPKDIEAFNNWLAQASEGRYIEAIVSMWMYPKELVNVDGDWSESGPLHIVNNVADHIEQSISDPLSNSIDGWVVKNKKTLCYPYTMLYVSNNMGGCATYRRELFNTDSVYNFRVYGALSPDSGVQLVPEKYKSDQGSTLNFEEALSLPAFPTCAWNSDTYKIWLAQNQNQHELLQKQAIIQAGAGALTAVASTAMGNVAGAVGGLAMTYNALTQVQGLMAQKADMAIQPDQARGNHSASVNLTHGHCGFSAHFMTITKEYAKSIDDYFTRYGYKVNTLDIPSLKNRETFTYIKTVGCLVSGNLGTEDQLKIQAIFDKGVTFWADTDNVGNFVNPNGTL